jgi:hypothetical protein
MTVDCRWVEKNLEGLFCDQLSSEENRAARTHIENCTSCRTEVDALHAIDPLIRNYFRRQLAAATRTHAVPTRRMLVIRVAAVAAVALLLVVLLRTPQITTVLAPVEPAVEDMPVVSAEMPPPVKAETQPDVIRAKPSAGPGAADRRPVVPAPITATAPDFLVSDPAGYAHTLEEYRGQVVIVGVWSSDQPEAAEAMERLYKAHAANPKVRLIGVSHLQEVRPAGMTFPVLYNRGSRLLGAEPGEFVVVSEDGIVELRGSLVKDFDSLRSALENR